MKSFKRLLTVTLAATMIATAAYAQQVWRWSTTSATNAGADPSINWAEGMAPSAVNDSARAMMAAIARQRLDISGSILTTGTSTAYVLTTNSSYTPAVGTVVSFFAHATNGAAATLNVDGSGAKPIQIRQNEAAPEGLIVAASPYSVLYCASCNAGAGSWLLHAVYGAPTTIPIGGVIDYAGTTAPNSNFALANGQCISRATYSTLFALVGTTFSTCDGATTFGVPDLRGRVVAGTDMGGGVSGRITVAGGNFDGTVLGGVGGAQNHTLTLAQSPAHSHTGSTSSDGLHSHTGTTLTESQSHTHSGTTGTESVGIPPGSPGITIATGGGGGQFWHGATGLATPHTHSFTTGLASDSHTHSFTTSSEGTHSHTVSTVSQGGGGSHPIVQPTMTLSKLIRIF